MDSIFLIFICLFAGVALQRVSTFPKNGYLALNTFVIYVALPALALYYIPKINLDTSLLFPLAVPWVGFGGSFLFFSVCAKIFHWSKKLTGCLILTAGLGNTSFVGFPVVEALYGSEGLKTAIIVDQPGSFVVLSTLGLVTATFFANKTPNFSFVVKKILFFPPFVAFVVACGFNILQLDFPAFLQLVFLKIGNTVTPVALVAVGLQLQFQRKNQYWPFLSLGLLFKLILTPLFFFLLFKFVFKAEGLHIDVSIIEAAMAPMITGAILASNYGLKPKLSAMMVGIGIPLSFVTLALWYWVLLQF